MMVTIDKIVLGIVSYVAVITCVSLPVNASIDYEELQSIIKKLTPVPADCGPKRPRTRSALLRAIKDKKYTLRERVESSKHDGDDDPSSLARKQAKSKHLAELLKPLRRDEYIVQNLYELQQSGGKVCGKPPAYDVTEEDIKRIAKLVKKKGGKGPTIDYLGKISRELSRECLSHKRLRDYYAKRNAVVIKAMTTERADYIVMMNTESRSNFSIAHRIHGKKKAEIGKSITAELSDYNLMISMASISEFALDSKNKSHRKPCLPKQKRTPITTDNAYVVQPVIIWEDHPASIQDQQHPLFDSYRSATPTGSFKCVQAEPGTTPPNLFFTFKETIDRGYIYNTTMHDLTVQGSQAGFIIVDDHQETPQAQTRRGYAGYHKEIGHLSTSTEDRDASGAFTLEWETK